MPLKPFDLKALRKWGEGLLRPEDVAVSREGRVFATDPHVGAREILPDGTLKSIGETVFPGCSNGISMDLDGRILIANLGAHENVAGPLERLNPATGKREVLLREVEGRKLTSCNYPMIDRSGNIWCSNSIADENFQRLYAGELPYDGFLFVLRPDGSSSIVADGLGFANGLAMSADENFLYCCQSFASNVIRYPVLPGGRLGSGEQYGPQLGPRREPGIQLKQQELHYPDGCAFDVEGNLWVTLFWANKVMAITAKGELLTLIDDPHFTILNQPSNVTFGGADMKDVYIGGLETHYVVKLRSPVAGMKLAHQV